MSFGFQPKTCNAQPKGLRCGESAGAAALSYQWVRRLSSLQSNFQVWQGGVHLIHLFLTVVHVVVWRHDGELVDVVLRKGKRQPQLGSFLSYICCIVLVLSNQVIQSYFIFNIFNMIISDQRFGSNSKHFHDRKKEILKRSVLIFSAVPMKLHPEKFKNNL